MGPTGAAPLAEAYRDATGAACSTLGRKFASDGSFFARLDDNPPTRRKFDLVVERLAAGWPDNGTWPPEVPHPQNGE